ncbi:general transcription factor IIE subunit 1-like [Watersipora subatra]|uniref:general transcription factor IIE subunit 1-like n=1 Tax=Watersipora subatra TaxID=2589382 RepID=UPI00355B88A3
MDGTEVVTEVPDPLRKLLKFVMRGFYTIEETLIIDMLLRNACMKEEDISELLKLDKKQMGVSLKRLKNDQFIKTRMKMESDADGKTTKHNYYFIHYTGFVNVVKYKLDHVRRKLEVQERDSTSRASFKCTLCMKTYTDLEADHLFDMNTGTFNCMMCGNEMEEQQSSAPVRDARALVAKFNEQIEKLFDLLRTCDKFKLSHNVLEPAPIDIRQLGLDKKHTAAKNGDKTSTSGPRTWSGDATKNVDFNLNSHKIDVKVGDEALDNAPKQTRKEQPSWLTKSTVDGVDNSSFTSLQAAASAADQPSSAATVKADSSIMNTLLIHESKSSVPPTAVGAGSDKSDDSDMEDVNPGAEATRMMESDDDEEIMVAVGDKEVAFHEAAELVDEMTDEQREAYNRVAQNVYSAMYD